MSNFEGFVVRGLLSVVLSRGPETLCEEINLDFPDTMQISDHGWAVAWFSNVPWLIEKSEGILKRGKKLVLTGHSFGGTAIIMVAQALAQKKLPVHLLCPIDPAYQYTTVIPPSVQRVVGFYQRTTGQLGQGIDAEGKGWDPAKWKQQIDYRRYETHLEIINDPFVHTKVRNAIKQLEGA